MLHNYTECSFFAANGKMKTLGDAINGKVIEKEMILLGKKVIKMGIPYILGMIYNKPWSCWKKIIRQKQEGT